MQFLKHSLLFFTLFSLLSTPQFAQSLLDECCMPQECFTLLITFIPPQANLFLASAESFVYILFFFFFFPLLFFPFPFFSFLFFFQCQSFFAVFFSFCVVLLASLYIISLVVFLHSLYFIPLFFLFPNGHYFRSSFFPSISGANLLPYHLSTPRAATKFHLHPLFFFLYFRRQE
ncbi:MAG: hypothetical protein J3R72DRAFT_68975 [Linnemannia gamsii]|nr:MAG: hypothetical protein J3R72DRAFT_68975 [Linnemannia gamsii]